jgi:GDPmannose 4,6-dehydratase
LRVGNTKIMRDWGYAPEYVKVMWKMLNVEKSDDYVICSGEAHTLQEFIDKVFINLNLDPKKYVQFDKNLYRPVELEKIYGNPEKAKLKLNWEYNISFDELIQKLIEDEIKYDSWRKKLSLGE